ncbi:hypothetical protein HY411_02940 [Candidatus Gottesmanbacteria bacterium]|nr:hypothetical protein [Candidatus Gottesmanbacteria bacterium]
MNQTVKVTMYSPTGEGLGDREFTVTGLRFAEGWVTVETTDGRLQATLDELGGGRITTLDQILSGLSDSEMSDEEQAARSNIRRGVEATIRKRAIESFVPPGFERRI